MSNLVVEVKGAIMASSHRVLTLQAEGERWLAELVGPEEANALIANRVKRDGARAHITLAGPKDAKGANKDILMDLAAAGVRDDIVVKGLGRAQSGDKIAYFVVVSWPAGREFRLAVGLEPDGQDFHVTIGFGPDGDVHGVRKNVVVAPRAPEYACRLCGWSDTRHGMPGPALRTDCLWCGYPAP